MQFNQTQEDEMNQMGTLHGRSTRKLVSLLVGLSCVAGLAYAAPAMALKPTGEFANFSDCPLKNPSISFCVFAESTSGEFKIGSTAVPLSKPVTLQGGLIVHEDLGHVEFVGTEDGKTLSKTPETVPGGLLKIIAPTGWPTILQTIFNEFINKGITGATATTELVAEPTLSIANQINAEGIALILPVRVHLENSFLGNACYIGSKTHPVNVEFTTGTTSPPPPNTPITGSPGELSFAAEGAIIKVTKNSLVNNSFAAPVAEGCGSQILFGIFTGIIDSAVDSQLGLPSAAGHNTAILNGNQELGSVPAVVASEK
jgi:hypothetical protein